MPPYKLLPQMRNLPYNGILSGGCTLSSFDMLLAIGGGVEELDVPFAVPPLWWFFCLLGCESFHFVPCILPFLGAFVYL